MPFGTNLADLIATFSTTGKTVAVNSRLQKSAETHNYFENPLEYEVMAEDGSKATYEMIVTVPKELFSCINDPVTSNVCGCLAMNDGSGLIWYADGSKKDTWASWCSHTGSAADIKCTYDRPSLRSFNTDNHCGYNDWHLPTATILELLLPVDQIGENWGALGTFAKNNGWMKEVHFQNS